MSKKVFIDGSAGTTGLRIAERLESRTDIELIRLSEEKRKDTEARRKALNSADIAFLCLPDEAAREAVALTENPNTVILDTSTAHRTNAEWVYGFPELSKYHEEKIVKSTRIAVPGCHASGFISLIYPLVEKEIIKKSALLSCFSLTGYSGGGKKMIAEYESAELDPLLTAPRQYGLLQNHKHLPEMTAVTGLENAPAFIPVVAPFYSGMEVTVPIFPNMLNDCFTVEDIRKAYSDKYTGPIVSCKDSFDENGFASAGALSGTDSMEISVSGNSDRILLISRYDNLGKGASGAAVECMNLVLGVDRTRGLELK